MDLTGTISELIDLRSFSNLWYWIALAVMWSSATHWVLGVPFDMVGRARRHGGRPAADLEDLVRINSSRLVTVAELSGLWMVGLACFFLTVLGLLGFVYAVEFAQAVFLLVLPLSLVWLLSLRAARSIRDTGAHGEDLYRRLAMHRLSIQGLAIVSIFVTSLWGMYQNAQTGPLGG